MANVEGKDEGVYQEGLETKTGEKKNKPQYKQNKVRVDKVKVTGSHRHHLRPFL